MEDVKRLIDKHASWLLLSCALAALAICIIVATKYPAAEHAYHIELALNVDSVGNLSKESQVMMDSVLNVVRNQNEVVLRKYDAIAEGKIDEQRLFTIGGFLLTILVSVLGFFGFRSFNSIEEKAINLAEGAAKKKLDEEMGAEIADVERRMETKIINTINNDIKPAVKGAVSEEIEVRYNKDLTAKINFINEKEEVINTIKEDIEDLKQKYSELDDASLSIHVEGGTLYVEQKGDKKKNNDIVDQIKERREKKGGEE